MLDARTCFLFTICIALLSVTAGRTPESAAQTTRGFVEEGLTLDSSVLGRSVRYTIYLPRDYESSQRNYPVTYLLHGYTDDDTGWLQFGEANRLADAAIATGEIPPMILAMPDAGLSYYLNNHDSTERYEDFFITEIIPFIESTYRARSGKQYRGIAGLSMGGHGALLMAMKNPDTFSAAAAFSAAIFTDEETTAKSPERWDNVESRLYGPGLSGSDRLTEHYYANNPVHLAATMPIGDLKRTRWYVDCGDDDHLYKGNSTLHIVLRSRGVPHEYRVRDGGHRWAYWRESLIPGLAFIGESFHQ